MARSHTRQAHIVFQLRDKGVRALVLKPKVTGSIPNENLFNLYGVFHDPELKIPTQLFWREIIHTTEWNMLNKMYFDNYLTKIISTKILKFKAIIKKCNIESTSKNS